MNRAHQNKHQSVAVIVVNYNAAELLGRSLRALFKQIVQADEIIVVDNDSNDDSLQLKELQDPRITLIRQPQNLGFAAANNLAIATTSATWIALLNPDCFPEPEWLHALLTAADHHPHFSAFASRMMVAGREGILDGTGDDYHLSGLFWRRHHGRPLQSGDLRNQEVFSPCAGAALYRRLHLLEAGGFDSRFFCYGEDIDLGYRLRLRGHRSLYVADSIAHHVGSATSGARSPFTIYHGHRNLEWVFLKNTPSPLLALLLPLHLFTMIVIIPVFIRRGEAMTYLRAKKDAFAGAMAFLSSRKSIQSQRRISSWQLLKCMNYTPFTPRRD